MFVGTNFGHQSGEPANKPTFWLHSNTKASHTKPPFSPLTVGQKSPFLTLALLLPSCPPPSDPLPFTYPVSSPLPPLLHSYPFLCSGLLLWSLLTPQLPPPLTPPPGPAGLCGANHQTAAPLSPLTKQLPPPQQYTTLLSQSTAPAATIPDPHLANRGGGLGQRRPQWSNGRHAACELLRSQCGSLEWRPLVQWDN